ANHIDFDLPIPQVLHTGCPHAYRYAEPGENDEDFAARLAASLDGMIQREGPDTIAAFIAEPVMGAGGVIIPPAAYFEKIQAVLEPYDILLIADEVICGFGRTGRMFGSETFGIKPDSISIAKAVTSAYVPLGAMTVGEDVYQSMLDESRKIGTFGHGYTYSGHPVSCAVANKVLEIYERDNIVGHVQRVAPAFNDHIAKLADHPLVGHSRGVGLIGAVELVRDKETREAFDPKQLVAAKAVQFCQEEGVILRAIMGDAVGICPPLIISNDEIDELFAGLTRALDRTMDWLKSTPA
ncbi:MAG: aminotransferase class III-fold pyridoxal phosphate-dependent enzyme, partial [Hyphomicrobiaceae bacterium]